MTKAARRVLSDCESALEMLDDERDEQRWRVLWIGAMALLRTVGHVLRKVDGEDLRRREEFDAAYKRWKDAERAEHAVFREFIDNERNRLLKEYSLNVVDSAEVGVGVVSMQDGGVANETAFILDENLFRPVMEGFGAGEDARDVYRLALEWWDSELSQLEGAMNAAIRQSASGREAVIRSKRDGGSA